MKIPDLQIFAPPTDTFVSSAQSASAFWRMMCAPFLDSSVESGAVLLLDAENRVIGYCVFGNNAPGWVMFEMPLVFRAALLAGAELILIMHNHPSCAAEASTGDLVCVTQFQAWGKAMSIEVFDFVVVTFNGLDFYSAREKGALSVAAEINLARDEERSIAAWNVVVEELVEPSPLVKTFLFSVAATLNQQPAVLAKRFMGAVVGLLAVMIEKLKADTTKTLPGPRGGAPPEAGTGSPGAGHEDPRQGH